MKRLGVLLLIGALFSRISYGQNIEDKSTIVPPKNSIVLANDFIFSLSMSYERIAPLAGGGYYALRGGLGYTAESGDDLASFVQTSMLFGKSRHFLDLGVAYYHNLTYPDAFIIPLVGYRYIGEKGLTVKVYGDLLLDIVNDSEWGFMNPSFHISLGWRIRLGSKKQI